MNIAYVYQEGLQSPESSSEGLWSTAVFFSSVLPVKGKWFERAGQIWQINKWLQDWCHSQGFGYLDHVNRFEKPGLLGADVVLLSEEGKSIFGHRLAKLVKRSLN